jgi:hypothetical protein
MIKRPLRRLNPYRGLIVDVGTWSAAHDYHRAQHRLHTLSMHSPGVVAGLEVVSWNPPDSSMVIYPGVALDSEGHTIIVGEPQRFHLQVEEQGTAYLVIRYREVADELAETPGEEEAQARFTLEGYTFEERRQLPEEAHLELARVEVSGGGTPISDADHYLEPGPDQIDLRHRMISGPRPLGEVGIGVVPLEATPDGVTRHLPGAMGLVRAINSTTGYRAEFKGPINLNQEIRDCDTLLVAGREAFTLTEAWESVLHDFLERGGVLLGEVCRADGQGAEKAAPFSDAFKELAERLQRKLTPLTRGHDMFTAHHLFAEAPDGIDGPAQLLADSGIVFSDGDYGCLWDGGRPDRPAPRSSIRPSIELGINLGIYSFQRTHQHSVLMASR